MKTRNSIRILAAVLGTAITSLTAAPVIHEPFAQTAGAINGKPASATGLTGNWTLTAGTVNVVNPDTITHGALAYSGGQVDVLSSGNTGARVTRNADLATAGLLNDGATLWFSMVFQKTAGGGSNEHSGFALGSSHLTAGASGVALAASGNALGFYVRDTAVRVVNWTGTANVVQTSGVAGPTLSAYSTPTILVGKIEWGATASDVEKITLYQPNLNLSSLGTAFTLSTVPAFDQTTLNTISFAQRNSSGTYTFDEIRFGATQADVLPADTVAPTLLSITDNMAGGPIGEDVAEVTYTLTFDEHMDISTITAADFDNAGTATATVGTITQVSPAVISVKLLPTTTGTLQLRIPSGSVLSSLVPLNLDTTSAILDDTTITINAGTTLAGTPTTNRWWDGGTTTGLTNGASGGGNGTWDNGTTTNWDRGAGFEAPVAWNNSNGNTAIFDGTAGTVTLGSDITLDALTIGAVTGYFIGAAAEDSTLTFTGTKTITGAGSSAAGDATMRCGIAGSPTLNITGRGNNSAFFALEPPTGVTMTLGTVNMLNTFSSNKVLRLGGGSTGNTVDKITWPTIAQQLQVFKGASVTGANATNWTVNQNITLDDGTIVVDEGTLIFSGTTNIVSHFIETRGGGKIVLKGNWRMMDEDQDFRVLSGGIVAPGANVATVTFNWDSTRNDPSVGLVDFQTGSTYEWEVGAGVNNTDVIALTETVANGNAELVVATGTTLKVVNAGGSPSPGDKLTVFTCASGVVAPSAATLQTNMTIDLTGTTWTGTPTWGIDTDGSGKRTIYITGLSGTAPAITVSGSLTAMSTTYGTASAQQSFTVSGTGLTGAPGNLTVAPPAGFEVSLSSGAGYTTSLSVPYSSATLASTTVYVRLAATAPVAGSPYSGNITVSGGGATSQTIATVSSTVGARALTFTGTKPYDGNASATAAQLAFTNNLDGGNLTMSGSVTLAGAAAGSQSITDFSGLTLGGSAAGNYTLTGASGSVTIQTPYQVWLAANGKTDSDANRKEFAFGTTNTGALVLNEAGTSIVTRGQAPIITTTVGSQFVKLTYARRKNSGFTFAAQYSADGTLTTWLPSNDPSLVYTPGAPAGDTIVDNGDEMEIVSINFPVFRDTGSGIVKMPQNFCRIAVTP